MHHSVIVFDMSRTGEPDGERVVSGFATVEAATDYAIARVRASVEELRGEGTSADELRRLWFIYGEDARVVGADVRGWALLDMFIASPATKAECDWPGLTPRLKRFHAVLLVSNGTDETVWAGGFFRAFASETREELLARFGADAVAAFERQGIAPAVAAEVSAVAHQFELFDPPEPPPGKALKTWRVSVGFVCHDVKFGSDASGLFAWPDKPEGAPLAAMARLLIGDRLALRGDGPDYANYSDVLRLAVEETDAPADFEPG